MKVICYGDSNTYGFDPRGWLGGRYDANNRWVDILARRTGWEILNWGLNGRAIPSQAPAFPADTDLLMVMLGTNDLLQGRTPSETAQRMLRFLAGLTAEHDKILLIAPPQVAFGAWVQEQSLIDASAELAVQYRALAERLGVRFADAGAWGVDLAYDGVHFTEQGHRAFAEKIWKELTVSPAAPENTSPNIPY